MHAYIYTYMHMYTENMHLRVRECCIAKQIVPCRLGCALCLFRSFFVLKMIKL